MAEKYAQPLQPRANVWSDFFEFLRMVDVPTEFMAERPVNAVPQETGIFDGEISDCGAAHS
jgi:antitoxin VapB